MDSVYDHIQEESYPQDPTKQQAGGDSTHQDTTTNFNTEIQDAYKAISSSPWASRIGGFFGTVKKQGEQYYETASKQYAPLTEKASAGVSNFISHARSLSVTASDRPTSSSSTEKGSSSETPKAIDPEEHPDRPESLSADIIKEAEGILSLFKTEASKRLKDVEKAEDAADEALLKFGSNIRNFLRDAVTIAPPQAGSEADKNGDVLFESKDSTGKKVVHATRFDAQLHVIHSTLDSFLKDPVSPLWAKWQASFDVEKKTDAIAKDLDKYEELRSAMEKCVPERVEYATFWARYYFLRFVIESEEQRRREMLKASNPATEEEVAWDEDSDEDSEEDSDGSEDSDESEDESSAAATPSNVSSSNLAASVNTLKPAARPAAANKAAPAPAAPAAAATKAAPTATTAKAAEKKPATTPTQAQAAKPNQPRRSNDEKSVADSDASYDLVSGATSRAPGSPQEMKKAAAAEESEEESEEESDEEDWE